MMFRTNGPGSVAAVVLGVFLACAMPAPARADNAVGALLGTLNSIFGSLIGAVNQLFQGINSNTAATVSGMKTLAGMMERSTSATIDAIDEAERKAAAAALRAKLGPGSNYACALATWGRDDVARDALEKKFRNQVAHFFAVGLFSSPDSGTAIGARKIRKALCNLGAMGKRDGCDVEIKTNPNQPWNDVEGADVSLTRAILDTWCLPYDPEKIKVELHNFLTKDEYKISDPHMRKMMVALLHIRLRMELHEPRPAGRKLDTAGGIRDDTGILSAMTGMLAKINPILIALSWHMCPSDKILKDCGKNNAGSYEELLNVFTHGHGMERPPKGYCLSRWQRNVGMNIRDRRAQLGTKGERTPPELELFGLELEERIDARIAEHNKILHAAALAAKEDDYDIVPRRGDRPVGEGEISENTTRELMEEIRRLTRALEAASEKLPRALEARARKRKHQPNMRAESVAARLTESGPESEAKDAAPPSGPAPAHASPGAMLPPIRQDFPVQ